MLPDLVLDTLTVGVDVGKVGADGAYDDYHYWDALTEAEGESVIPPRESAAYPADGNGYPTNDPKNAALPS